MKLWEDKMDKAKILDDVNFTCAYYVLSSDNLNSFYVDTDKARGGHMLNELRQNFVYRDGIYQQVLYMGHVGSGKSTLISKFGEFMQNNYHVVKFSIQDLLNSEDPSFSDLLYALYYMIFSEFKDRLNKIDKKLLFEIYNRWNATITVEEEERKSADIDVEAGINLKLGGLFSKISNSLKMNSENRKTIKSTVSANVTDYINSLNKLLDACSKISDKPLLFIIDDLEKRMTEESAREIFINRGGLFKDIRLRVLLTAPILLNYVPERTTVLQQNFTSIVKCPMIMVTNSDGNKNTLGIETLKEIIYKRVDKTLIDDKALEDAILFSGGVLRDLLKMMRDAACQAAIQGDAKICITHIEMAKQQLQSDYENVFRSSYLNVVKDIYINSRRPIDDEHIFLKLISAGIIIEYNGKQWKGIAPAIVNYLKEQGLL